jgi:hypothetical protein
MWTKGGVKAFTAEVPNGSLCADGELARVGFMTPDDARGYVKHLEPRGLKYLEDRNAVDIVVDLQPSKKTSDPK